MNSTQTNTDALAVTELWSHLLPFEPPDKFEINLRLRQSGVKTVVYAIEQIALKRIKLNGDMTREYALRLCGAICSSVARERKHIAAAKN